MKNFFSLSFLVALTLVSSTSFAGVVDIRFSEVEQNADSYCATVQIKAQDIAFEIGSGTVFFQYNAAAVDNPTSTPINFSATEVCGTSAVYQNSFTALKTANVGEGNYSILLTVPNAGCPSVTDGEWVDVARFCFDVIDGSENADLEIVTKYTAFNTVDNGGDQHELGDVQGTATVSSIEDVVNGNVPVSIYPNFTADQVNIDYSVKTPGDVAIVAYDMMGRTVYSKSANVGAGIHNAKLDLSQFGNGYYLIEVNTGDATVSEKVLLAK